VTLDSIIKSMTTPTDMLISLKQNLTSFFDAIPDPIFVISPKGKYLEILGGNAKHLYSDGSMLKDKNISDIFSKRLCSLFLPAIKKAVDTDELQIIEYMISSEDLIKGDTLYDEWFEGRIKAIKNAKGDITAVVWFAINISEKKELEKHLRGMAECDALTGLYNRRFFDISISKEFNTYKRYNTPFSVVFIDIDNFKSINDTYGQSVGDQVLVHMSSLILSAKREADLFFRYGGEEFILLMPQCRLKDSKNISERLRKLIQDSPYNGDKQTISYTISIGLSEVSYLDKTPNDLACKADKALYKSKNDGRNMVTSL